MPTQKITRTKLPGALKAHAIVIAINRYEKIGAHLQTPQADANALKEALVNYQGFDEENVHTCYDPTKAELETFLAELKQAGTIKSKDGLLFYYAGHGLAGDIDGAGAAGYLMPSDVSFSIAELSKNETLIKMEWLFEQLEAFDCHHTLAIMDCCFAGAFRRISRTRASMGLGLRAMTKARFQRYQEKRAWQVLASAGPAEKAADLISERGETATNSPFAQALVEVLSGKARSDFKPAGKNLGDGILTSHELFIYLHDEVERRTRDASAFKPQNPDLFPMGKHDGGQFIFCDPRHPKNQPDWDKRKRKNPYKGLSQYDLADADYYFGRTSDVTILQQIMRPALPTEEAVAKKSPALLLISGPSGSGKSSLVKAGLLPAYQEAEYELFQFRPGDRPWSLKQYQNEEWIEVLHSEQDPFRFVPAPAFKEEEGADLLNVLTAQPFYLDPVAKQVLYIDQFEELFTSCTLEEQAALNRILQEAFEVATQGQLRIVISMRSDFEWQLELSEFGQQFWGEDKGYYDFFKLYRLATLGLDDLRAALVNPATLFAYEFEQDEEGDLADAILEDLNYLPSALPLLSYTMQEMVKQTKRSTRRFLRDTYKKKIGGVSGALSKRMQVIYDSFGVTAQAANTQNTPQQELLRDIFLRMVSLSDGDYIRRRVYRDQQLDELRFTGNEDAVREILLALRQADIISTGGEAGVRYEELIHDSLINTWTTGKQWINDFGKENLSLQRQLWQAVLDNSTASKTIEDKSRDTASSIGNFSRLWDGNSKLMQVIQQIIDASSYLLNNDQDDVLAAVLEDLLLEEKERFLSDWATYQEAGEFPDLNSVILEGNSAKLLRLFLDKGKHWLNRAETDFIQQSWEKRIEDIVDMKQQRDEALALAMTSRAQTLSREEKPTALRIAQVAWEKTPQPLPEAEYTIARVFYSQFGTPRQPLSNVKFTGHSQRVKSSVFSQDGTQILTASDDNTAKLWDTQGVLITDFVGHTDFITSAIFSTDGTQVLTASYDKTAKLWNTQGEVVVDFVGHTDFITSAIFSTDGTQVLTASDDKTAKLWNAQGEVITTYVGHEKRVSSAVFSPNGTQILTASDDKTAKLWNDHGVLITDFAGHNRKVSSAIFSSDGTQILTASYDKTAKLWDTQGKVTASFVGHKSRIHSAVFAPDGNQVLTVSYDKTAKLWNTQGEVMVDFVGHQGGIYSAVFSPSGTHVLTASYDDTAKLWDAKGALITDFVGHLGDVYSAVFSPDGTQVLTASDDCTPRLWDVQGALMVDFVGHQGGVYSAMFSPDGTQVLTAAGDFIAKLWDAKGTLLADLVGHQGGVYFAIFSPNGTQILTVARDKTAKIWDTKGTLLADFAGHKGGLYSAIFSPDGTQVLTASEDNTAKLWGAKGTLITDFTGHTGGVYSAIFSPDGTQVLTASEDNTAKLWDTQGALMADYVGHTAGIYSMIFSPDSTQILTIAGDNTAKIWDTKGVLIADLIGHTASVNSAVFSSDGTQVLTASGDFTAKLWNIKGELIADFIGHKGRVNSAAFSPDGTQVLTVARDKTAKLWNTQGALIADLDGHTNKVNSAIFSPDGTQILTASGDFTAKLWNTKGELIADIDGHEERVYSAIFSPDGTQILTAAGDFTAKLWPSPQRIYNYLKNEAVISQLTMKQRKTHRVY